jgi:putative ABC transport system permease protein
MPRVQGTPAVSGLLARLRSVWRGLRGRAEVEAGMSEEFNHHLELRTEDLISRGVAPREAARRARIEFGHVETHKEAARASRGLRVFDQIHFSWLDVKLGLRMLRKYPGLSLVSVIGMSVAIAIGAGYYGAIGAMIDPTLPLDEGDRIVSVQNADRKDAGDAMLQSAHDFVAWRNELKSIRDLSAFRTQSRNVIVEGKGAEPADVAEMTAAGFRVARVAPVLGRPILEEDEQEGAPPVVLIAYEEWQNRFDADPAILGRTIKLGSELHTVVGVMPADFRFPRHHRFWVPLRLNVNAYPRGNGPVIRMFGRLADGVSLEQAQAELSTIGQRNALAYPQTHEHLRPMVSPYTHPFMNIGGPAQALAFRTLQLSIGLLLVVVALNVAVLVYARTSTRAGEIAMRSALGASRKRVITQLFAEAFVLSVISAVIGLALGAVGLRIVKNFNDSPTGDYTMPFWVDIGLSPSVIVFVAGLAILAGLIIGVLPGLQVTSRLQAGLQQLTSRAKSKQLGRTWTALIVIQVAIAVAILPFAMYVAGKSVMVSSKKSQIPGEQILRAQLVMRPEGAPSAVVNDAAKSAVNARFMDRTTELLRRIEAEPGIAGAAFVTSFPGEGYSYHIEVDGEAPKQITSSAYESGAKSIGIAPDLFTVLDVPIVAGRAFVEADAVEGSTAAIVDRAFVEQILGGGGAIGRRIRIIEPAKFGETPKPGPWLEIVGMVPDFLVPSEWGPPDPILYRPLSLTDVTDGYLNLAVRTRSGPADAFARRLTDLSAAVDPTLQVRDLNTAAAYERSDRQFLLFLATGIAAITASVLLLSATGIYAMMSFTVAGRRREIGIRTALGADRRRVLSGVFARAGAQLGAGVLAGLILAAAVNQVAGSKEFGNSLLMIPLVALVMISVGLLSALGPARRVLNVQPTEALRSE